ncbi:MAG TPA: glycosyltransferase family 4 protein [Paludibacter sp.]|nr:glycosyltransferase family 4 protein [Paludibacter sp.]
MRVLWITNILFPDVCSEIGIEAPVIGGWMHAGARSLLDRNSETRLAVATLYDGKDMKVFDIKDITYFLIPKNKKSLEYNHSLDAYWKKINARFNPEIVHIHGTEYPLALCYVRVCGNKNVVVSIQGIVSVTEKFYFGGIPKPKLIRDTTLRDLIRRDTVFDQHAIMQKRGFYEEKTIRAIEHVIGRTSWDRIHMQALNPSINYHFCNETLREAFYHHTWELSNCQPHSIFITQGYYPLKGLHQLLHAMPLVTRRFPDAKLYIGGVDFITNKGMKINGYGKFIRTLIKRYGLGGNIYFTGLLSEEEMCRRYLGSHVVVCPSYIENSSNSIGEAQMLGVPCVASYVGGISDLITDQVSGLLYRVEEHEMLAEAVCTVFSDNELASRLSANGRKAAWIRHDRDTNASRLGAIYQEILGWEQGAECKQIETTATTTE